MDSSFLGGVDLGGTKIISGIFSLTGGIIADPVESPTQAESSPEKVIDNICRNFRQTLETAGKDIGDVSRLGLGVPTTLRYGKGLIDSSPNLPTMTDFPLGRRIEQELGVPVVMEKDANCFILGELARGAARGFKDCCGVTIGTGLGLGVVLGGRLIRGTDGCAGEIWTCPYRGDILENHTSGSLLVKKYEERCGEKISGREIHRRAAEEGEGLALELFQELGRDLGAGISWLVNVLNPGAIVLGGSVAQAYDLFIEPLREVVDSHRIERNRCVIRKSALGRLAPLYGAAFLPDDTP